MSVQTLTHTHRAYTLRRTVVYTFWSVEIDFLKARPEAVSWSTLSTYQGLHLFLNLAVKSCRWETFYQTSPWTDNMSTTPLPEATVHMCHYPTWPVFGSTHGSEAKRETAAALPISYEIMAAVHWVVLLCLTTLPEPIMAPMNRKRAGVQGFLFLHEDYHQNMHLTTVWK